MGSSNWWPEYKPPYPVAVWYQLTPAQLYAVHCAVRGPAGVAVSPLLPPTASPPGTTSCCALSHAATLLAEKITKNCENFFSQIIYYCNAATALADKTTDKRLQAFLKNQNWSILATCPFTSQLHLLMKHRIKIANISFSKLEDINIFLAFISSLIK